MTRLLLACLLLTALAGCSRLGDSERRTVMAAKTAQAMQEPTANGARRTLAYKHSIQVDAPEEKVGAAHEAGLAACRAAELCTVLDSRVSTGRAAGAFLRLRAKPAGIQKLIAAMGQQGSITEQSTQAEDLAAPLQDGEKKLAMLTAYRAELEALRKRATNDVDALIKVTRELAQVQSDLEAAGGQQAYLVQRVETEILEVTVRAERGGSFWRPVSQALNDFGGSLSQGVSSAITGVAYLLPWALIIGLVVWVGRKLWRRTIGRRR